MHSKEQDVDLGIEWHEAADYQGFESFKCFGCACFIEVVIPAAILLHYSTAYHASLYIICSAVQNSRSVRLLLPRRTDHCFSIM